MRETPFFLMHGFHPRVAGLRSMNHLFCIPEEKVAQSEVQELQHCRILAHQRAAKAQERQDQNYTKPHRAVFVESGDFIMVADSWHKGRVSKFYPPLNGPFMFGKINGPNVHCLPLDRGPNETMHVSKLKPLKGRKTKKRPLYKISEVRMGHLRWKLIPRSPTGLNSQVSPINKKIWRYGFLSFQGITTIIHSEGDIQVIGEWHTPIHLLGGHRDTSHLEITLPWQGEWQACTACYQDPHHQRAGVAATLRNKGVVHSRVAQPNTSSQAIMLLLYWVRPSSCLGC